ncbi:MAG: class I SAM-dependent methyltransferase [Anaerolineae bacterium]
MRQTDNFWDSRAESYDDKIKKGDEYSKTLFEIKRHLKSSDVVLDFGCASGEFSLDIAADITYLHGIDTSGRMIDLAKKKLQGRRHQNASFSHADLFDESIEKYRYSAVVALNVLHLVDDLPAILDRLTDLLPPGGLLISTTPCLGERRKLLRATINIMSKVGVAPTVSDLTTAGLKQMITESQFELVETAIHNEAFSELWLVARKT